MSNPGLVVNYRRVYAFNAAWSFLLIQAVLVPFFLNRGLPMSGVFLVITAFSLTLGFLDVPTGYLSDLMGRRATLILASLFKGLGGTALLYSSGLPAFTFSYVLIGIGNSLYSGSDISLLFETHEAIGDRRPISRLFGNRIFFAQLGGVAAAIAGGYLAAISLETAAAANALFAWVPFFIALTLKDAPRTRLQAGQSLENFRRIGHEILHASPRLRLVAAGAVFYGAAPILATYALQGLWSSRALPLATFGYLTSLYGLVAGFSARGASRVERRLGTQLTPLLVGALAVLGWAGASASSLAAIVTAGLCLELVRGLGQALLLDRLNAELPADLRATGNSVVSLGSRILVAAGGPLVGWLADGAGFSSAFLCLASIYAVALFAVALPLSRQPLRLRPEGGLAA
jgi:MFS family permease